MGIFHRAYVWTSQMPDEGRVWLPADIADEFATAALLLPMASTNLRAPLDPILTCSDATPTGGGVVEARVSRRMAEQLYTCSQHKGEYTRQDWAGREDEYLDLDHFKIPDHLQVAVKCCPWRVSRKFNFKESAHVNLQEALAVKSALKSQISSDLPDLCSAPVAPGPTFKAKRLFNGSDSRVVNGAWRKGRSSSFLLNGILRSCIEWEILGNETVSNFYIHTKDNPADDPSRHAPIRAPIMA